MLKKIVNTDNFNSDYPDEYFLNCGTLPEYLADIIVTILNRDWSAYSSRYWKIVDENYKLQPGFEP